MTNKEAIETLRANYPDDCYEQLREAVDIAISALSAQPEERTTERTETHACDCISRKAAIDELKAAYWDKNIQSAKDDPCIVDAMTDWAIRKIKRLPSAQPSSSCAHENDSISRRAAIDAADDMVEPQGSENRE